MNKRFLALALTGAVLAAPLTVAPANATPPGTNPLSAVLTSDGNRFDDNAGDFDIVTEAVLAVLDEKPTSDVGLLTDGSVALTAFVPTDQAFRMLLKDLTGMKVESERRIFKKLVATVGVDTIETVLLYHVVPGDAIYASAALTSDGAELTTAQGGVFTVDVLHFAVKKIALRDADPSDADPIVIATDVNTGNLQIAHGINRVLRPLDL